MRRPSLNLSDQSYRYSTVAGEYVFPVSKPFVMRYRTAEGQLLVAASTFVALGQALTPFVDPTVVSATDDRFEILYGLRQDAEDAGSVDIAYDFRDDGPPKISAQLRSPLNTSLSLGWIVLSLDTVAWNGTAGLDFANLTTPRESLAQNSRLHIGPTLAYSNWTRRLVLDWGDAPSGRAWVGRYSLFGLNGSAALVKFPMGMTDVDPSVAGTSSVSTATASSIQRKTFFYGNRFWAFWHDGTDVVYASSTNGTDWTAKMPTGIGAVATGFDVDQRDGKVLVGYVPPATLQMKVLVGAISASAIAWSGPFVASSWWYGDRSTASVAVGTDGYFWVASAWRVEGDTEAYARIVRSTTRWGTTFSPSGQAATGVSWPSNVAVRLIAVSNGNTVLIWTTLNGTDIKYMLLSGGGGGPIESSGPVCTAGFADPTAVSAAYDGRDQIHIAFAARPQSCGGLGHASIHLSSGWQIWSSFDTSADAAYPTTGVDANGQTHVFWVVGGTRIRYTRELPVFGTPGVWSPITEPFPADGATKTWLAAGAFAFGRIFLIWTQGTSNPYQVRFGDVPAPTDVGSQTGDPWNRQGLSPYQSFFQQFSEYVSPGSGLLTIKQTDLVLPGRGLTLEISRVHTTPRAFSVIQAPSPYLYEEYPWTNLGNGWQLNLPWLSQQYVHLWDGQLYVISWQGDTFENHDGEPFTLTKTGAAPPCSACFSLFRKDGTRYDFDEYGRLRRINDTLGDSIGLYYSGGGFSSKLSYILDDLERNVTFAYNANGTLHSISSGPQTVSYEYFDVPGAVLLARVADAAGRVTSFGYTDSRSVYLVTSVRYPTGGRTSFNWGSATVGPDLHSYSITKQDTLNATGASIRSNTFNYSMLNGRVTSVKVDASDAGALKGSIVQIFDSAARRTTTVIRNAAEVQLRRQDTWFDSTGAVGQTDAFPGTSSSPAYASTAALDEWGNPIYTRDPVGHERFASFANTRYQGGYYASARINRTTSGWLFSDDFDDRVFSDWTRDVTAGPVELDFGTFETALPSLRIRHNGGAQGVSSATHTFGAQGTSFAAEIVLRPEETNRQHTVWFRTSGGSNRVYVSLRENGYVSWNSGSGWNDLVPYQAKAWYHLGFNISVGTNRYDIWLNGALVKTAATMPNSGSVDRLAIQSSCVTCGAATTYVDSVKVYKGGPLTIQGLTPGQIVRLYDGQGRLTYWARTASGTSSVAFYAYPGFYPSVTLTVSAMDTSPALSSPVHEFWGGDVWMYEPPWLESSVSKTRSGFLRGTVYVEDSVPGGISNGAEDGWNWVTYDPDIRAYPVSGTKFHPSKYLSGVHQHNFTDANNVSVGSSSYLIQYIQIPDNRYPAEVMLQYRDTSKSWNHRAYWGTEYICADPWPWCSAPVSMGTLPYMPGQWIMLTAKASDIGMASLYLEGISYVLYGGHAAWDFSAIGDADTGGVWVDGLSQSWTVEVHDPQGGFVTSSQVPGGASSAFLNLYASARKVRAFPFDAYFLLKDATGSPLYRSPVLSLWGGDSYRYSGTDFYPNIGVMDSIHGAPVGSLEFQTGRSAPSPVRVESYVRYTPAGLPDRSKARDGTAWRETQITYDATYGFPTQVVDPGQHSTLYSFSASYGHAYPTQVRNSMGGTSNYAYDPATGWLLSEMDPRGYRTRYEYDGLGRLLGSATFDLPTSSDILYFDMERTTEDSTPRQEDISGKAHHGTLTGTTVTPGSVGTARSFDGSFDEINAGDIQGSFTAITFAAWLNIATSSPAEPYPTAVSKESNLGQGREGPNLFYDRASNTIVAEIYNNGVRAVVTAKASPVVGHWYHVAMTYDGSTLRVYLDGWLAGTSTAVSGSIDTTGRALRVGRHSAGLNGWNGAIDEVRVFNRALSDTEVLKLASKAFGLLTSSRTAYDDGQNVLTVYEPTTRPRALHLNMEAILGGKVEDLSGHGNHATNYGAAPASGANCQVGGCFYFDGTDRMEVSGSASLSSGKVSVAAWFRVDDVSANHVIIAKREKTSPSTLGYALWVGTDGRVYFLVYDAGRVAHQVVSNASIVAGTRYHVVALSNGATVRLYLNGAAQSSTVPFLGDVAHAADPLTIGAQYYLGAVNSRFKGHIDEVHVFDRGLNATEVLDLYQGREPGHYEKQYFDSLARTTRITQRSVTGTLSTWETYSYSFRDQVLTVTRPRDGTTSYTTTYEYDFLGRPTKVTYPYGNPVNVTYDDANRIRTVVAENGRKVEYVSDAAGRNVEVREYYAVSSFNRTRYAYDDIGNLVRVENPLAQVTTHSYDSLNRLTRTTYADSKYEGYAYDLDGELWTRTDRAGHLTAYLYDALHRLSHVDYGNDGLWEVTYGYDANGNPTSVDKSSGVGVYSNYDGLDRLTAERTMVSGGLGVDLALQYAYDAAGRVTRLTYPDSAHANYAYDGLGRTSTVSVGSTAIGVFSYFADGLVQNVALGNLFNETYLYNGRGWPTSIKATNGAVTYLDLPYAYDGSGNIVTMGGSSFTYDKQDRIRTGTGGFGSQSYGYDALGDRTSYGTTVPDAVLTPNGDLQTGWAASGCTSHWDCLAAQDAEYVWSDGSQGPVVDLVSLTNLPSDASVTSVTVTASASHSNTRRDWCYPNCISWYRLELSTHGTLYDGTLQSPGTGSQTWTTNPYTGQAWTVQEVNDLAVGAKFVSTDTILKVNQLSVTVHLSDSRSYTYANGPTGMNQLTSMTRSGVSTSFGYDDNLNLISRTSTGAAWTYTYDQENLMTAANLNSAQQQAYAYDGLGRRTIVYGTLLTTWTVSLFSGADVVFEKDNAGATTKYVLADGLRLAKITPSGAVQYYLADHEGSTRQVRDANRNLVFSAEYEPFGKPYAGVGGEGYTYTGEKVDSPTGLVYLRARQYDPELGRFVSADPVLGSLSAPQTQNRFTYVVNNPLKFTDPSGQTACNPGTGDQFFEACERWAAWDASVSNVQAYYLAHPFQLGPWETLDFLMMLGSFLPGLDTVSDAWFIGRDLQACAGGSCDWGQLGLDAGLAALPLASIGLVRLARLADRARDAARWSNRAEDISDVKGWRLGDPVNTPTRGGKYPSWSTVRSRMWKNAAEFDPPGKWATEDLARMQRGRAPIRDGHSMEIHHISGRGGLDPHNPANLKVLTWLEHRIIHGYLP